LFNSTDSEIQYGALSLLNCNLLTNTKTNNFRVTATVPTTCRIATNDLNFGTTGSLIADIVAHMHQWHPANVPTAIGTRARAKAVNAPTLR
jgi:hypothetical protein